MMRVLFVCVLAVLGGFAGPGLATPERLTASEDRIVAATQTHIFVLRDIFDNQGSHYTALHDQHLVEIDLESGEAARFWPLRRMTENHLETGDLLNPGTVTEREGDTHDMFAILRDAGAQVMIPRGTAVEPLSLVDGALMRGETELFTPFGIRAAGRAQLAILREYYPPIETEDAYRRAERIDFYDLYAAGDWDCVLRPEAVSLYRARESVLATKLYCEDADMNGAWSFHILVRKEH